MAKIAAVGFARCSEAGVLNRWMFAAISSASSGLLASAARLGASASNIANAGTTGPVPATPPSQPLASTPGSPQVYQPVDVVQVSLESGARSAGVAVSYRPRLPAYVEQYDPSAPFANGDGMVAAPNVDLAREAVGLVEGSLLFKANLAVLRAADAMTRSVLDTKA